MLWVGNGKTKSSVTDSNFFIFLYFFLLLVLILACITAKRIELVPAQLKLFDIG
jgi:hypothetical protein